MKVSNEVSVYAFLKRLTSSQFYGRIEIKFEKGRVVHVQKVESLAPSALDEFNLFDKST